MRGWSIVLILSLLGGGLAFWYSDAGTERGPLPNAEQPAVETGSIPDPLSGDRTEMPGKQKATTGSKARASQTFRSAVTILAIDAANRRALQGFEVQVLAAGRPQDSVVVPSDRHTFQLPPGTYTLLAKRADCEPAKAVKLTVTRSSEPTTIRVAFTAFEATLHLRVIDQATQQELSRFRATVRIFEGNSKQGLTEFLPNQQQQPLVLPAKAGQRLEVRIEAEGYTPAKPVEVRFDNTNRKLEKVVFLAAQMKFAGIELRVTDTAQQPIPRLNVILHSLVNGKPTKLVWDRTRDAKDGTYRLPDLQPGPYQLQLTAVDKNHCPTLHLTNTQSIEYFDGQHIIKPITLAAGAMLELRVTDLSNNVIGKGVWVELTHPDGQRREVLWQAILTQKRDGHTNLGANKLTADAPAQLHRCLPGGRYHLKLQWGQGEPTERFVELVNGRRSLLQIQVSK
jgi:hypothetical protein